MLRILPRASVVGAVQPVTNHRRAYSLSRAELHDAQKWYKTFDSQQISRKNGKLTKSGKEAQLQYPLADLLSKVPAFLHEEVKKSQFLKGKNFEITCKKHPLAAQNEEEAWQMIAAIPDMIACRVLPATYTKFKPKELLARVQDLIVLEREARKGRNTEEQERLRQGQLQQAAESYKARSKVKLNPKDHNYLENKAKRYQQIDDGRDNKDTPSSAL